MVAGGVLVWAIRRSGRDMTATDTDTTPPKRMKKEGET